MKKLGYFLLLVLLTFSFSNFASSEVKEASKIKKDTYATSEDILIKLIEPDINRIIKEKYGKEMIWQVDKVIKVGLIMDHTKKNSDYWYHMKLSVRPQSEEVGKADELDIVDIRIDVPNIYGRDRYKETNSKMKITLIEYFQVRQSQP
ncbi:DUF3888 domain-containing protein [Psychrobacillus vulpis]|uniref:DUF3888 domain-containing protein n=1 Tax=Psychrobacillus vulpis TaxID=2325572 RepID=A0A544TDG8_9BACI|nr:DUF3888 domain-containing protein [Psychrobacillus vulpis]TQR15504.1 DUF3888 domain-containing protein [Psychrobacillus vulpis]